MHNHKLLTIKQVMDIACISTSKIYRDVPLGKFPAPIHLGSNCIRWIDQHIQDWIDGLQQENICSN